MIKIKLLLLPVLLLVMGDALAGVVVIGHAGLGQFDAMTVQRIYTGKVIEVGGVHVTPVNLGPGPLRDQFLQTFLNQSDERYTAYWAMRRFVGRGVPPRELPNAADVIKFVESTPGAIGYIDEEDIVPEVSVVAR